MRQVAQTPDQHYYLNKLLGYDYEIRYKPVKDNKAPDALSLVELPQNSHFLILPSISFDFLKQVKSEIKTCKDLKLLKENILTDLTNHPDVTFFDGIL